MSDALGGSVAEELTQRLRKSIISGEIPPGEKIHIKEIERRFGVSHIPIREALRRLEAEHLVSNIPRRGAIATPVSAEQLIELYDLRRMIEPEVAARASLQMTDEQLADLRARRKTLDALIAAAPDSDDFLEADQEFHWGILEPGATPVIERTLRNLWQMCERYVRLGMKTHDTPKKTAKQHRAIFDAVVARDEARIREVVETHLTLTEHAFRSELTQFDEAADAGSGG